MNQETQRQIQQLHYLQQNAEADRNFEQELRLELEAKFRKILLEVKEKILNKETSQALTLIEEALKELPEDTVKKLFREPLGFVVRKRN